MNKQEFEVLRYMLQHEALTQREWADKLDISLGKVNKIINGLKDKAYLDDKGNITDEGRDALKPYRVDNAIIMAAGMSSRFAPISFERPKGLLNVKGQILIERQIEQLMEAGIEDITVVVGYMKESFFYLADKYPVRLVINEDYYKYNNPSTLMLVKEQLKNTYICSCDDYFTDNVFELYVYEAYYAAKYAEGYTEEYCMTLEKNGRIKDVSIGGSDAWYMLGHVYFSKEFSEQFVKMLVKEYANESSRALLWEQLYMKHIDEFNLYVKKYRDEDIFEFDSLDELRAFDSHYINNTDSKILKNICRVFGCEEQDIYDIVPIKQGLTNLSFSFLIQDKKYVYRHPGVGTEEYINRQSEAYSMGIAKELNLDDTYLYMDKDEGWKISVYIEDVRNLDYHNQKDVQKAVEMMRRLHQYSVDSGYPFDIWEKVEDFIRSVKRNGRLDFAGFQELYDDMKKLYQLLEEDRVPRCLCHNDCYSPNFLVDKQDKMYLIDWEYSGLSDAGVDLGTFICCSDYTYDEALDVLRMYYGDSQKPEAGLRHEIGYVAIASFYWFVWALYQECNGSVVGEYLMIWYRYSKLYVKKALELYK